MTLLMALGMAGCGVAAGRLLAADPVPAPGPILTRASGVSIAARYRTCKVFGVQGHFHQSRFFAPPAGQACGR